MTVSPEPTAPPDWPRIARSGPPIRVSFSVLLRVRHQDRYVLFNSLSRPNSYGPPGGVIKYFPAAAGILEQIGFQQETRNHQPEPTGFDLRGLVPIRSVPEFLSWFDTGAYREDTHECLRRELDEELTEVGFAHLGVDTHALDFRPVRIVIEGPDVVPHREFLQLRRFEIVELRTKDTAALTLISALAAGGGDPACPGVICADRTEIERGRCGAALLGPQCAFLIGAQRLAPDLPPVR